MFGVQFPDLESKAETWSLLSAAGNCWDVEFMETYLHAFMPHTEIALPFVYRNNILFLLNPYIL